MPIDWFTVAAQVLNFVVLLWLLKRFLYGPVLAAVDAREKRIAQELADAASKQAQALAERDGFARRNAQFDGQRASQLAEVQALAQKEHARLLEQARESVSQWSARRQATLQAQARQVDALIRAQAQQEVFAITRKTLSELASVELEQSICQVFVDRLGRIDAVQREQLRAAVQTGADPVRVRSAFALSSSLRDMIRVAVQAMVDAPVALEFSTHPELIGGVELICGGHKIGWSIAEYLDAMAQQVVELLQAHAREATPSRSVPAPAAPAA